MGAGSKDLESHRKRVEDQYPYEPEGVAALLRDIYRAEARAYDFADLDTFTILADLKIALDTDCLTPRQRQVVALYYFAQLTQEQIAELLDLSQPTVVEHTKAALERIAREMKIGGSKKGCKVAHLRGMRPLYRWLNEIAVGFVPVYFVPEDVATDLLHWLSERGDNRAWETLFQRRHGAPEFVYEYASPYDEYPCLCGDQFKWRDRRMSFTDEVKPPGDVVGYRYASPSDFRDKEHDDEGYAEPKLRKKIFKHFYPR